MTRVIEITVRDRIAWQTNKEEYICGNSDFVVDFVFDAEWESVVNKTARFVYGNQHKDVVFDGNRCEIPKIFDARKIKVGVFAGNLKTTTPAKVPCKRSILCDDGLPADPTPDVYAQIMEKLNEQGEVTEEQIAQAVSDYMAENPVEVADAVKTVNGIAPDENGNVEITVPDSDGNVNQGGLTTAQIEALDGMFKVCAFTKADVSAEYSAFKNAFGISGEVEPDEPNEPDEPEEPEVTLARISATYSGGDVVEGTPVTALIGVVVTAHYSDGTSETVTGYNLSGTIAEGSNTVTVSYGGKTTTFEVTGVAESGGEDAVQYGLYFPAAYVPTLVFGGEDIVGTHQINKVELTVDLPTQTAGNKIILSSFLSNGGWFGFAKNTEWVTPLGGTTTPNAPSAVLGQGKKTISINFTPAEPSNWGKISLGWGSGNAGNPEFTFYEMKCYMDDVLMADFKPTATLGEIYESVKGVTRTTSSTEGLRLVGVSE